MIPNNWRLTGALKWLVIAQVGHRKIPESVLGRTEVVEIFIPGYISARS